MISALWTTALIPFYTLERLRLHLCYCEVKPGVTINSGVFTSRKCPPERKERPGGEHDNTVVSSLTLDNYFLLFEFRFLECLRARNFYLV